MKEFSDHWRYITTERPGVVTVQNRDELDYVYHLIEGCSSYLEIGTAEGNSLYVLSHALAPNSEITYVDYGEKHTTPHRDKVVAEVEAQGHKVRAVLGDSNDYSSFVQANDRLYDVVFIDAGHEDFNVAIDTLLYAPLATKYIIFHDIQIPDVNRVFEWYARQRKDCVSRRVINSKEFGYGILEVVNG